MSHFTVMLVINPVDVEALGVENAITEMLQPYYEVAEGSCTEEHLDRGHEFRDHTAELREEFKTGKEDDIPISTQYSSFEEFAASRYEEGPDGTWGYWVNPKAKWDWYSLGGRWAGMLPLKENVSNEDKQGEKSWANEEEEAYEGNRADFAKINEIDWEKIDREAEKSARSFYKKYKQFEESGFTNFDVWGQAIFVNMDLERYGLAELVEPANHSQNKPAVWKYHPIGEEEEFVRNNKYLYSFSTYAVLDGDGWHAPGEMGWFGMSSDNADESQQFKKDYRKNFIDSKDPESVIAIVDCHI